jgi:chondroitin AC lyase
VGGVSNGQNGIAVMEYNRDSLTANKSWFMFGDKVLCLGSNINANTQFEVTTSVNQVFLNGEVDISINDMIVHEIDKNQILAPDWLLHNNTGYLFPKGGNLKMESKFLEGKWTTISSRYRPIILTEAILRLWLNHGSNPVNQSYAYVLVPNADKAAMESFSKNQPFQFVNEINLQSAISSDGNTAGIVFYKAGSSALFGGISANQPCVVMLEKTANGLRLYVSDPSQNLKDLQISFQRKYTGENIAIQNNKAQLTLLFPEGFSAGDTMVFDLLNN